MVRPNDKQPGVLRSLDWWTIGIYLALLIFGWLSVCGASFTYGDTDIFSLETRSGMQIVWIGTSVCLGFVILMLDDRFYDTFAFIVFGLFVLLLFATIFNPHEIKGSRSWLVLGPLRLQPAECGGEADEYFRIQHPSDTPFCHGMCSGLYPYATDCRAEGDGICPCLSLFLPCLLP